MGTIKKPTKKNRNSKREKVGINEKEYQKLLSGFKKIVKNYLNVKNPKSKI